MFQTEKHASPFSLLFSSFNPKKPAAAAGLYKPFEETLIARLSSLLPLPSSPLSIPLSWLSRAVDILTLTLADAAAIISDPSLSTLDLAALSSHLDSSVALLDACNAISAAVDRILHGRLLVRLALHLIVSSSPSLSADRLRRARSAIAEWEAADASSCDSADLSRLRSKDPMRGRMTCVRRAVYAVEAISDLVARSALAFLGEKGDFLVGVRVSGDFAWAAAYNEVAAKVSAKICCGEIAGEIEAAKRSVRRLAVAVGGDGDGGGGGVTEELRGAVRGAEEAMEELTEGMDRLANGVNGLFRGALETREAALQCFRVGHGRCN